MAPSMGMRIELTPIELEIAALVGRKRQSEAMAARLEDRFPTLNPLQIHIVGAMGELAAAKALGVYWPASVNTFHAADLGKNIQIRTITQRAHRLCITPRDDPEHYYILVFAQPPWFELMGWIYGVAALQPKWLNKGKDGGPLWMVPGDALGIVSAENIRR